MNELQIEGLSKTYPNGVKALKNVTITIKNGLFGLLGPNGAGKSSLMRTIAGLQSPTSGRVNFNKVDILAAPNFVRRQLGYLPQEFGVYPKVSAEKLLDHLAVLKGVLNRKERDRQIGALLDHTGLWPHRKKAVYTFSGGMRQRFGIAQALLGNPQLIIVDEPTAGLDPEERSRFLNFLSEIGEQVIVLLSTHIVEDVQELCAEMAIMFDGRILTTGSPSKMVQLIKDKIWTKRIEKSSFPSYQERFDVISTKLVEGKTQVRVYAEYPLEDGMEQATANLEDVYFLQMSKLNH